MRIINGKKYKSDCARIIRKFDIYLCDLGDIEEGMGLGKTRPCVIVQSNKINHPLQNGYVVAPIRTEHEFKVTKDTLQEIVDYRRNVGRIYVPIEDEPGSFRFIDITEMRKVASCKVLRYKNTIINPGLRQQIDNAIYDLLFGDSEYDTDLSPFDITNQPIEEVVDTPDSTKDVTESLQVNDDESEIGQKINKAISEHEEEAKQKVIEIHKKFKKKEITKSEAAKQLGLSIKEFDRISKEIRKEEKESKGPSKYSMRKLPKTLPTGFSVLYKAHKEGKMTIREMGQKLGKSNQSVLNYMARYEQLQEENKVTSM